MTSDRARADAGDDPSAPAQGERRTRGGWVPSGVAADRRDTHARRATARGIRSKSQIVSAARRVFERLGYVDATVEDIVKEAGIARGSFYTYFPSKREVFHLVESSVDEQVREAVSAHPHSGVGDVKANLRLANSRYIRAYRENAAIISLVEQLATIDEVMRARRLASRRGHIERVAETIRRWQRQGMADASIDPSMAAAALVSMLSNFCYWWFISGAEYDEATAADTLTEFWSRSIGLEG
jgi:AcrR family transcriptional regulator